MPRTFPTMHSSRVLGSALALALVLCLDLSASVAAEVEAEGWRGGGGPGGRHGPPTVTLYERPNFGGASLDVILDESVLDLSLLRFPNGSRVDNKVSSIFIERGAQVRIYVNDNFRGEYLDLTRSVENLSQMARAGGQTWNDAISSLRVTEARHVRSRGRDPSRTPRVIVFSRKDFEGEAFEIFPGETLDNLNREHFESGTDLNKEISSVRVVGAVKIRLYFDQRMRGESVELTSDTADLNLMRRQDARKDWNDKASSLVVEWIGPPQRMDDGPDNDDNISKPPRNDDDKQGNRPPAGKPPAGGDKKDSDSRGNF